MNRFIDLKNKKVYQTLEISEKDLQNILLENFELLFPNYIFLSSEFRLKGDVRLFGIGGRIDILAVDVKNFQIVVVELKKLQSKHILVQAIEYTDFIEDNLELILLKVNGIEEKLKKKIIGMNKRPKIVLIANKFLHPSVKKIKRLDIEVDMFQYDYYENGFIRLTKYDALAEKINLNENNLSVNANEFDSLQIVIDFIENGVLSEERFYKIEGNEIFINGQNIFNIYRDYCFDNNEKPMSKSIFINGLKKHPNYIGFLSKTDFKFNRTSAYHLKLKH